MKICFSSIKFNRQAEGSQNGCKNFPEKYAQINLEFLSEVDNYFYFMENLIFTNNKLKSFFNCLE